MTARRSAALAAVTALVVTMACTSDSAARPDASPAATEAAGGPDGTDRSAPTAPESGDAGPEAPADGDDEIDNGRTDAAHPRPDSAADDTTTTAPPSATTTVIGERCWQADPASGEGVRFVDRTAELGLIEPLTGMYGHATAAADVNGNGWIDLFVAGFADRPDDHYRVRGATGPSPDRLLLGGPDGFRIDPSFEGQLARTSGATFADLTGDGRLELIAVRNPRGSSDIGARPTTIYRQTGDGWEPATTMLDGVGARAVATIDVERNGLLDLVITADRWIGGSTRFLRNLGDLRFEDATGDWGVPDDMLGLAVATVDLDGDGWVDVVISGDDRVLMGGPNGFRVERHPVLTWEELGTEDDPAGIAVGDLTGDGRPDLVIGHHFNSTVDFDERVPVRIFLNRAEGGGFRLDEVTDRAGSPGLWTKSPHVAIVDLDNDGRPDIVTSALTAEGFPLVLRNVRSHDGDLRFEVVGDRADGDDYLVTGVEADLTRNGRIDVFQVEWFPDRHSPLFTNESASGSWVQLDLADSPAAAGGSKVEIRHPDHDSLLGTAWVATSTGYAAGPAPIVHIGLGDIDVDRVIATVHSVGADPVTTDRTSAGRRRFCGGAGL